MNKLTESDKRTCALFMIDHQLPANMSLDEVHRKFSGTFSFQVFALNLAVRDLGDVIKSELLKVKVKWLN